MTSTPATASAHKNPLLAFAGTSGTFEEHVSSVMFQNGTQIVSWRELSDVVDGPWTMVVAVVQDWENPDSLANYLLANAGDSIAVTYKPDADGEFSIASTVKIVAPAIGGPVNAFNESTVTMPATKPVPTFPTP